MPENEMTETQGGQAGAPVAETRAQKFEREQLSRRAALRKMGYTSALAAFALFGVDDVVRLVGRRMQQQARDNQVANQVAIELGGLQSVGLVFAGTDGSGVNPTDCSNSVSHYENLYNSIIADYNNCIANGGTADSCTASTNLCSRLNNAAADFAHSCPAHCPMAICRAQVVELCAATVA